MWKMAALLGLFAPPAVAHDLSASRCSVEDLYLEATDALARRKGLPDLVEFPDFSDVVVNQVFSLCDFHYEFTYSYETLDGDVFEADARVSVRRSFDAATNELQEPRVRVLN